jgi:DNA-binding CsgD family transcriptional regulator
MDKYWDDVLEEVMREGVNVMQTTVSKLCQVAPVAKGSNDYGRRYYSGEKALRGPRAQAVYLGCHYPGIYLTPREAHTALLLLKGYTMRSTAMALGLSARTVEYYLDNIKAKLGVRRRADVITGLLTCDFLDNLRYIAERSCKSS